MCIRDRYGLNDNAVCQRCGSDAHFSHNCNNIDAQNAMLGRCWRCKLPGHTQGTCEAPRCTECGDVGHLSEDCSVPLTKRLDPKAKDDVKRQEIAWGRNKDRARERRAEKKLGEHAVKIPIVKSTLPPNAGVNGFGVDGKRKRDEESR